MKTVKVGILGATGMVGQRFMALLDEHPWFKVTELVASERSAGKKYVEAAPWVLDADPPAWARDVEVKTPQADLDVDLVFSAMPAGKAGPIESTLAARGIHVFSNARDHRWDQDVPLLLPEVNPDHLSLVERQKTPGKIVTNGNCSTIMLMMGLAPLHEAYEAKRLVVSTYQALSGAGWPGVPSLSIQGNIVPYIGGEEEKMAREPTKYFGRITETGIEPASLQVSATCVRVNVNDGHTIAASAEFVTRPTPEQAAQVLSGWRGEPQRLKLPSAPARPVHVRTEPDRPQPRKDNATERGMAVTVGRIREDPVLHIKWVASGSNTIRGAAGTNVLGAELFVAQKRL